MLQPGKDFDYFNPFAEIEATRANLPHWQQPRVLYFVTFRQADSIPSEKLKNWRIDYNNWLCANPKPWKLAQAEEYEKHFARKIEKWLDASSGTCSLADKACQKIVADCLEYAAGTDYRLDTYTLATNHVHALLVVEPDQALSEILKKWKGITARRINQHLDTSGQFWQKESYDHIVRNETALNRIRKYIQAHKK